MQYQSPFELLGITLQESTSETFNPVRLRKQLLAEFELSGKSTITVPGGELSKNDVLKIIDELRDPQTFRYHQVIFNDEALNEFLIGNHLDGKQSFADDPLYSDENFLRFITPYYAHAYCEFIIRCFQNKDYCSKPLQTVSMLVTPGMEFQCLEPVRTYIHNRLDDINRYAARMEQTFDEKISNELTGYFGNHVIHTLNMLPSTNFENELDQYFHSGLVVIDSCIREDRKGYRNMVVVNYVCSQLNRLPVPEQYKEGYERIRKYLNQNYTASESGGSPDIRNVLRIVVFAVIVLFNLGRFCSSDHSSSNSFKANSIDIDKYMIRSSEKDHNFKNLIVSLRSPDHFESDSIQEYTTFRTGDNPFNDLPNSDPSPYNRSYFMTFVNQSRFEIVILANHNYTNSYIYIAPKDSFTMGASSDSSTIAVLAGKKWMGSHRLPDVMGPDQDGSEKTYFFKGNFKIKPANYQQLLTMKKYAFSSEKERALITIRSSGNKILLRSSSPGRKITPVEMTENF